MTGAPRDKIRHTSWTWGRYVLDGDGHSLGDAGFDYYDEARHGAHNWRCERCSYDAVPGEIPEMFADRYQALCDACRRDLGRLQFKHLDWGEY